MLNKRVLLPFLSIGCLILSGCGTTPNVDIQDSFWNNANQQIAVAHTQFKTPDLYHTGQEGILDMAINNVVSDEFIRHIKHADMSWYPSLEHEFVTHLHKNKINAKAIALAIDENNLPTYQNGDDKTIARKNYTTYASSMGTDKLLVIRVNAVGATRQYSGFIPLGKPKAMCSLTGKLIDLKTNAILWQHTAVAELAIGEPWSQVPNYPNFDAALKNAVRFAEKELEDSFFTHG